MRRLPLIWLILLLGPLTLSAQPQLWDTLSVYLVYPSDLPPPQHKAPKGYKPFYISHLGRHGSRYLSRPEHYSYPLETLSGAADAGLLTGMGESLLRDLSLLAEDAAGREGMLVPRGEEEHRGIMARMCRNYPEVFGAKNARIHAVSTESVRAIMSMSCALEELRVHYPAVRIERECGPRITRSLFGSEGRKKAGKKTSAIKKDIVKAAAPDVRIVFVTAYAQYALEAWKKHVHGYLMKPVSAEDIREALDNIPLPSRPAPGRLFVRCFGDFEVFWQGKPLTFERRQTKELFAILIDKRGAVCTAEEAVADLWEDEHDMSAGKTRLRVLVHDLRSRLSEIGMQELLIRKRGMMSLDTDMIDCDYYRMLDGEMAAVNAYRGEYMRQYSWAEMTAASLYFGREG